MSLDGSDGCEETPSEERVKRTGASVILVHHGSRTLIGEMERDPYFENVDALVADSLEDATTLPVKVYRVRVSQD